MLALPRDLLVQILHWLPTHDLGCFAATCRLFYLWRASPVEEALRLRVSECGRRVPRVLPQKVLGWVPYLLRREWLTAAGQAPLAAATTHSLFVDASGKLLACGFEEDESEPGEELPCPGLLGQGQTGDDVLELAVPTPLESMQQVSVRGVAASEFCSMAVTEDGRVYSWGPAVVCLGHGDWEEQCVPRLIAGLNGVRVHHLAAGAWHSAALSDRGELFTWGGRGQGQMPLGLGFPAMEPVLSPTKVDWFQERLSCVAAGCDYTLVACEQGSLYAFGRGEEGQLGDGTHGKQRRPQDQILPVRIGGNRVGGNRAIGSPTSRNRDSGSLEGEEYAGQLVVALAAGCAHSLAMTDDGRVYSWGANNMGHLGQGDTQTRAFPSRIDALVGTRVCRVAAGEYHSCAISDSGQLFTWGSGLFGRLGHGDAASRTYPKLVQALADQQVVSVSGGLWHTLASVRDGSVYGWGLADRGRIGVASGEQLLPRRIPDLHALRRTESHWSADWH